MQLLPETEPLFLRLNLLDLIRLGIPITTGTGHIFGRNVDDLAMQPVATIRRFDLLRAHRHEMPEAVHRAIDGGSAPGQDIGEAVPDRDDVIAGRDYIPPIEYIALFWGDAADAAGHAANRAGRDAKSLRTLEHVENGPPAINH